MAHIRDRGSCFSHPGSFVVLDSDRGVPPPGRKPTGCFSSQLPQNRHPERSASQIYRVNSVWGAESKDPYDAYLVDAVRTFSTTQTREPDSPLRLLMLHTRKYRLLVTPS